MNQVNIIGTMTRDITLKYLPSGLAVGEFAIAVNQDYKKQDGTKVEKTSFFDITVMGKQSETINSFFGKGSRIGITGELEQQSWQSQDGSNRSKVIIKLQSFTFIDRKSDNNANGQNAPQQQPQVQYQNNQGQQVNQQQFTNNIPEVDIEEDEIPF